MWQSQRLKSSRRIISFYHFNEARRVEADSNVCCECGGDFCIERCEGRSAVANFHLETDVSSKKRARVKNYITKNVIHSSRTSNCVVCNETTKRERILNSRSFERPFWYKVSCFKERKSGTILAFVWLCLKSFLSSNNPSFLFRLQNAIADVQKLKSREHALNTKFCWTLHKRFLSIVKHFLLIPLSYNILTISRENKSWKKKRVWFEFMFCVSHSRRVEFPTHPLSHLISSAFDCFHSTTSGSLRNVKFVTSSGLRVVSRVIERLFSQLLS